MKTCAVATLRNEKQNQPLLSVLQEEGIPEGCRFIYRAPPSFFRQYCFDSSTSGIRRFTDFLLQHEDHLFDLPFCQECFLFLTGNFNYGMERLEGIIYRKQQRKPNPKEVYAFINRAHNQVKVYSFDQFRQVVYHHKLPGGTFPVCA